VKTESMDGHCLVVSLEKTAEKYILSAVRFRIGSIFVSRFILCRTEQGAEVCEAAGYEAAFRPSTAGCQPVASLMTVGCDNLISRGGNVKGKNSRKKILIAVDGSPQSLGAVQYVGALFPVEQTEIVFFHVENDIPDIFLDMGKMPILESKLPKINGWKKDRRKFIADFMSKAVEVLIDAGFPRDAVHQKIQHKCYGISRDIIEEVGHGYSALIVGRSGLSKLKDILIGSTPIRLIDKIPRIPLVVVGGKPVSKKILACIDGSVQSARGIDSIGQLLGASGCRVEVCHVIKSLSSFKVGSDQLFLPEQEKTWLDLNQEIIGPAIKEATAALVRSGFDPGHVTSRVLTLRMSRAAAIIEEAKSGGFESIVIGRRGLNIVEEIIMGRVSKKVLELANTMAVWVVGT